MTAADAPGFEAADDRTLYWTLSLYIRPEKLWRDSLHSRDTGVITAPFDRDRVAALQLDEPVSLSLRNAIEPLFNDISDRESGGRAIDFLLAADPDAAKGRDDQKARAFDDITFYPPKEIAWTTEGRRFAASTNTLADARQARLRRFWFVHADGALSWHLALTLNYRHDPADYLFLSMLQKLAAPKEFSLDRETLQQHGGRISVFDDVTTGIGPIDQLKVRIGRGAKQRFWPAVKSLFDTDVRSVVSRLAGAHGCAVPSDPLPYLLDDTGLIEVPGLTMPRCRTMMYFRDERFFARLSPQFDGDGNVVPRRLRVQDGCYAAYAKTLGSAITESKRSEVRLNDDSLWDWVRNRSEYAGLNDQDVSAIRAGSYIGPDGAKVHIPSFDAKRTDCLDYLFLSGFNQNIIDFMNQDTSEILDGTDPIYPTDDEQAREGFFVRFANHRSMITYAEKSRSLEVGNDYIGTCPYAFLVHVLSMHNEFLARDFEERAISEVADIERALASHDGRSGFASLSGRINALKIARYRDYEQHRYVNVFRYDTERDVFAELEQLRGVQRKETALELALSALEDHADDLELQRSSERERNIGAIAFVISSLALAQGFAMLADIAGDHTLVSWSDASLGGILRAVAAVLLVSLIGFGFWMMATRLGAIGDLLKPRARPDADRSDRPRR